MKHLFSLIFSTLLISASSAQDIIPNFPTAEGYGIQTKGGRGGKVIKVTNLNDHGPGSLREAISAERPRIIIFTVGGIINLETKLIINHPYLTIAGQTAPGEGICIRGEGISIRSHDVVVRYLRIRPGDIDFGTENNWGSLDAISIGSPTETVFNVVIDHCSLSWAVDEVIDIWFDSRDITIQNCIISEALLKSKHPKGAHGMGMLIGEKATNISVHHNLFSSNNWRNPLINGESFVDFRNNVIYNYGSLATHIDRHASVKSIKVNYVNNFVKKGPNSINDHSLVINERAKDHVEVYISGNIGLFVQNARTDNWNMVTIEQDNGHKFPISLDHRVAQEFPAPPVRTLSANEAYNYVIKNAGAVLPLRDPVDKKVVEDLKNNKGSIINSKNDFYEWPPYNSGIPFKDTDEDGLPDHWEERYGLSNQADNAHEDPDNDGYTNIEEFLNGTSPKEETTNIFSVQPLAVAEDNFPELQLSILAFPNPYIDSTTLDFTIDHSSHVQLALMDEQGKEIKKLINDFLYTGKYQIYVDTSNLRSGSYNIVLSTNSEIKAVKTLKKR